MVRGGGASLPPSGNDAGAAGAEEEEEEEEEEERPPQSLPKLSPPPGFPQGLSADCLLSSLLCWMKEKGGPSKRGGEKGKTANFPLPRLLKVLSAASAASEDDGDGDVGGGNNPLSPPPLSLP